MIKIFLFCFYKIWFEPMFLTGSFAVFIGAAPPHFRIFAGGLFRKSAFGLIQEYCTRKKKSKSFPTWCPWRESNPHQRFRRPLLCPLSYRGAKDGWVTPIRGSLYEKYKTKNIFFQSK